MADGELSWTSLRRTPSPPASLEVIDIFDDFPHYPNPLPHLTTGIAADASPTTNIAKV
jgi:hypothetical protein